LLRVTAQGDSLVSIHAGEARTILNERQHGTVSLYEQHVSDMAAVFEGGPHRWVGPHLDYPGRAIGSGLAVAVGSSPEPAGDVIGRHLLVDEPALVAPGHIDPPFSEEAARRFTNGLVLLDVVVLLAMVFEPELVGSGEAWPACLADGVAASGVLVVGGDEADAGVEAEVLYSWRTGRARRPRRRDQ
jgi:hypothetical protein